MVWHRVILRGIFVTAVDSYVFAVVLSIQAESICGVVSVRSILTGTAPLFVRGIQMITPSVEQIIRVMNSHGYKVFETGSFNLNLIGIRHGLVATNKFTDTFVVLYKDGGLWVRKVYPCTTVPGLYHLKNGLAKGTAILVPGQYRGAYERGLHKGDYMALVQRKPVTVYRDRDKDCDLDYENPETGMFGINIHRATANGISKQVDKWSAGCTVLASSADFAELMRLTSAQIDMGYGRTFTYTLLEEGDFYA